MNIEKKYENSLDTREMTTGGLLRVYDARLTQEHLGSRVIFPANAGFSNPDGHLALGLVDAEEGAVLTERGIDCANGESLAPARVRRHHPRSRRLGVHHHRVLGLKPAYFKSGNVGDIWAGAGAPRSRSSASEQRECPSRTKRAGLTRWRASGALRGRMGGCEPRLL